jgi:hypothetical protein
MAVDEIFHDGQPQAGALDMVGALTEEGIEDARLHLLAHADAGIADFDHGNAALLAQPRGELAALRHRVVRVLDQVEEDHPHLGFVGQDAQRRSWRQTFLLDAALMRIILEQLHRVGQGIVQNDELQHVVRRTGEQQQAARHRDAVVDLLVDEIHVSGDLLGFDASSANIARQTLNAQTHRA